MIAAHTDVVGSLLRPPELLKARDELDANRMTHADFKAIEDRAVKEAIALQEDAGLEIVTDGEMRRLSFQSQMTEAVDGFGEFDIDAFLWGEWQGGESVGNWNLKRPKNLGVVSKLKRKRHLSAEEFTYLRGHTTRIPKITLPCPSLWTNFWSAEHSAVAYPTVDGFLADVVDILREEIAELIRLGATYIQLDAPHYPLFLDAKTRAFYEAQGLTLDQWLEVDNAVISGVPDVTFGFHL